MRRPTVSAEDLARLLEHPDPAVRALAERSSRVRRSEAQRWRRVKADPDALERHYQASRLSRKLARAEARP